MNWDIFGFKARREAKKAEQERLERERKETRKAFVLKRREIVKTYLDQKEKQRWKLAEELAEKDKQRVDKHNSTCPNCGSHDAINKFVRLQGSLDGKLKGSSHGSHYGSIFGSCGSSSGSIDGSIHGEMDTIEVKECKNCGNQWAIEKPSHAYTGDYVNDPYSTGFEGEVDDLYRQIESVLENKWPKSEPWCVRYFKDAPREVIEHLIWTYYFSFHGPHRWHWDKDVAETIFGIPVSKYGSEHLRPEIEGYEFQFTDELWDTIQKLIRRGPYENFEYPKKDELDDF